MAVGRINQLSDSRTKFDIEEVLREPLAPGQFSQYKAMAEALRAMRGAMHARNAENEYIMLKAFVGYPGIISAMNVAIDLLDEEFDGVCMICFGENDGPDIHCLACENDN